MKTFIRLAVGLFMLFASVIYLFTSPLAGVLFIVGGLIALPFFDKYTSKLPRAAKYVVVIGCLIIGISMYTNHKDAEESELVASQEAEAWAKLTKEQQDSVLVVRATADSLQAIETAQAKRDSLIRSSFVGRGGAHWELENFIEENMNDPDSYEHVRTRYSDMGNYLLVTTTFRGNNAYGGKVLNTVTAKVDLDGDILEIVEQ